MSISREIQEEEEEEMSHPLRVYQSQLRKEVGGRRGEERYGEEMQKGGGKEARRRSGREGGGRKRGMEKEPL